MSMQLQLHARDVTLLPEQRPADVDPSEVPEHRFQIQHEETTGYALAFDEHRANIPDDHMSQLFLAVCNTSRVDWEHSRNIDIQSTFRPLNRVIQCLTTTPSYQLFLAGFHIADAIGLLALDVVDGVTVPDSFRYLVGNLPWIRGKKGRLFVLPHGVVADPMVRLQLIANGKLFEANFFVGDSHGTHHIDEKLIVPYATPIGFNTRVDARTEQVWREIARLVQHEGGGYAQ